MRIISTKVPTMPNTPNLFDLMAFSHIPGSTELPFTSPATPVSAKNILPLVSPNVFYCHRIARGIFDMVYLGYE